MSKHYHNTTNLSSTKKYEEKAKTQDELLHHFFKCHRSKHGYSASVLWDDYGVLTVSGYRVPLTSYRRSLNYLKNEGIIEPCGMTEGYYGRPETKYRFVKK